MKPGVIQNRERFLNHLAEKLGRKRKTTVEKPEWTYQPQRDVFKMYSKDELLSLFIKSATANHSEVYETTAEELPGRLLKTFEDFGGGPIVVSKDERFAEFGLESVLSEYGVSYWDVQKGSTQMNSVAAANIGLSFSDITLAESGTAVFFNDKNKARSINLLPVTSIIIVPKSTLVPRITQATDIINQRVQSGGPIESYINMVSGPSNSADIEMNLVVGVHGPIRVCFIVVLDK
jgi:L-lactate dehydrogenase complex protein LldG